MKNNIMDERQRQIGYKSMAVAGVFLMICVIIAMVYKVFLTDNIGWEFWALIGMSVILIIARRLFGDIEQPKSIIGKNLPVGNSKEERKVRKINYFIESAIFAFTCAIVDVFLFTLGKEDVVDFEMTSLFFPNLSSTMVIAVTAIATFIVTLTLSYIVEYIIGEKVKVKQYNEMIEKLEED